MRGERVFFGLVLVTVGFIFLLQNLGIIPAFSLWRVLWHGWPLLLIFLGISVFLGGKRTGVLAALLLFLVFFAAGGLLIWSLPGVFHDRDGNVEEKIIEADIYRLSLPWEEDLERLAVTVEMAAGQVEVGDTTDQLAEGNLSYRVNQPQVSFREHSGEGLLNIRGSGLSGSQEAWQVRLTDRVPLELQVKAGAGSARLELAQLQVEQLQVEMGAGDLWVRFGERYPRIQARLAAGASRVVLVVPREAGVKIETTSPLSRVTLPGYRRVDNTYTSPGYQEAETVIDVKLEAGISSLEVLEE